MCNRVVPMFESYNSTFSTKKDLCFDTKLKVVCRCVFTRMRMGKELSISAILELIDGSGVPRLTFWQGGGL